MYTQQYAPHLLLLVFAVVLVVIVCVVMIAVMLQRILGRLEIQRPCESLVCS